MFKYKEITAFTYNIQSVYSECSPLQKIQHEATCATLLLLVFHLTTRKMHDFQGNYLNCGCLSCFSF